MTSTLVESFEEESNEVPLQRVLILSCNEVGGGQSDPFKPLCWPVCQIIGKMSLRNAMSIRTGSGNVFSPKINREVMSIVNKNETGPDSASPLLGDFR